MIGFNNANYLFSQLLNNSVYSQNRQVKQPNNQFYNFNQYNSIYSNSGFTCNNYNINFNNFFQSFMMMALLMKSFKTPTIVDEEEVVIEPKEPDKAYILGSYYGDDLKALVNEHSANGNENDAALQGLLAELSEGEQIGNRQAVVVNQDGEILQKIGYDELASYVNNVGVGINHEDNVEGTGGSITLSGTTYDVAASVIKHSPLTFDLNGDGVKTSNKLTQFDINGDGKLDKINDVADGTLSIRGGKDGKDLFGNNTDLDNDGKADGYKDGFEALKALANKEGLINGKNDMVLDSKDIKFLEEKYQLGMKTDGYNSEEKSLAELGITEINMSKDLATTSKNNFDGLGNLLMQQKGSTFKINGQEREYADIWHTLK